MPIIKSAKKRVRIAHKATARNAKTKKAMRESLKAFTNALSGGKSTEIDKAQKTAYSAIDMAVKKNIVHKNKAARKKSQLSAAAKAAGSQKPIPSAKPKTKKPTPTSKPKKPAAKKKSK